ncbi:tetraacyldisaccharide 4'-kinase [Anaerobaca lacustris]|uniref:Tetraacyldisaccharide 4'-kinase n=1 Tax=Anaerobaca lacustris TaxID=3044600 RepID=A0AAW6TWN8_9BACT|nr:tetraacyldisaccharide 4'-kinase [Sedimentisphaerales bacterium M17dextr]
MSAAPATARNRGDSGDRPLDQQTYRKLISGQTSPWLGTVPLGFLRLLSGPYRLVIQSRNWLYTHDHLRVHRVGVPVVCVGNLTTGGTGKTPLVAWLARLLDEKGVRAAILTRGYKAGKNGQSDEPAELAAACAGVPVIVNADRVAGAAEAIRSHDAQVILMDDGFQHRRLARDLDIVTIDATAPFGYGRLLPAGLLREPVGSLKRAQAVVLTRSDQVSEEQLGQIETRIRQIQPDLVIARSVHAPVGARRSDGLQIPLEELAGKKVFAFCGLGNPTAFFATIQACGCVLTGSQAYNDHHVYTDHDAADLCRAARSQRIQLLLTTRKDWTKIAPLSRPEDAVPMAYLAVELRFTAGEDALRALIERAMAGTIPPS